MRWAALFQDFETQLYAASRADLSARSSELARAEASRIEMTDRLRAASRTQVRLRLRDGRDVTGTVDEVASQWLLLATDRGSTLIPMHAIDLVRRIRPGASAERSGVLARLGLGHTLRALARDRATVRIGSASGDVSGRIDFVGRDHLDVTLTGAVDDVPRAGESVLVPFHAILCVSEQAWSG